MFFTERTISCEDTPQNRELLRIPLLKDVFERYPTTPINIDVKENNDELIQQVIESCFIPSICRLTCF